MVSRPLALVAALAILASLFLPWLSSPFGTNVVPWTVLRDLDVTRAQEMLADGGPQTIAFGCSFVLAALFAVFALFGRESRLLALLTGALPVALVAWALLSLLTRGGSGTALSFSGSAIPEMSDAMLGVGAWAWALGASLLATLGVVDPGRPPRAYR